MTKLEELYKKMQSEPRFNSCYGERELIFTRYGANGFGSKTECFFEERKGELYALKRSTMYDPASSTYKMINETGYLKMCTIDEAVHFLKYA
jgi:hypothetical protein